MKNKSILITFLQAAEKILPGDYIKTFFYLNLIKSPRELLRSSLNSFYRIDHIYDILKEFKNIEGKFSILEFGVADGVSFTKHLFATKYMGMSDKVMVYGFDTFEGMPQVTDNRNNDLVGNDDWIAGQFKGNYEILNSYCKLKYTNYKLYKGLFENSLTGGVLKNFSIYQPILIWIDCDFYTSAKIVFEKILPVIPNGCLIYFDELNNINYGSRFTGESRLVHEINSGKFGKDMELVLDIELSLNSRRLYRFINFNSPIRYNGLINIKSPDILRGRTTDSPLP